MSPLSGVIASIAILFIVVIALAGLGLAVANASARQRMGNVYDSDDNSSCVVCRTLYVQDQERKNCRSKCHRGHRCSHFGVCRELHSRDRGSSRILLFHGTGIINLMAAYGFVASILPVWLLLAPRDYLSSYMKIGTIAALVIGVFVVMPELKMPMVTEFIHGGGPIIPGKIFPFVFVTIACGAISGFHALVSSGTTPKMLDKETDARMIGYGAMLMEGLVGIIALVAASSLFPGDYFAINVPAQKFAALGIPTVNLAELSREVGETIAGRPGGAVSLAVGFAQIFTALPGMKGLMSYWYHFAIMFEALFILTTIDAGTRVGRFLVQEFVGKFYKPFERTDWMPGTLISTGFIVCAWAYFIHTGSISSIWPMFGVANQLLASVALCVAATAIINSGNKNTSGWRWCRLRSYRLRPSRQAS